MNAAATFLVPHCETCGFDCFCADRGEIELTVDDLTAAHRAEFAAHGTPEQKAAVAAFVEETEGPRGRLVRTAPPVPTSFSTPREATAFALAVVADIDRCSASIRIIIKERSNKARAKMAKAIEAWTHASNVERLAVERAVLAFVDAVYATESAPIRTRGTWGDHLNREERARQQRAEQELYRRAVGLEKAS